LRKDISWFQETSRKSPRDKTRRSRRGRGLGGGTWPRVSRDRGIRVVENGVKAKPSGRLSSGNSRRPREKSGHVRGFPRRDTGTHLNLCFFPPTTVLKAPLPRA